ncbi:MAG: hypothetical protein H7Y02_09860 [Candidatus Obscuribacterales bacterium]|nr:hypothetical protein [Steroidobacteraceae bacterium]
MDRTYIESQQIVQRYLSGDLTVREARDFEKYCLDHPEVLATMPIPVRLKTKLARRPGEAIDDASMASNTALEAAGLTEDDDDDDSPADTRQAAPDAQRRVILGLGLALVVSLAGIAALWFQMSSAEKAMKAELRTAKALQLRPPGAVQTYRITPVNAPPSGPTVNIGVPAAPLLIDLYVNVSDGRYSTFLVTLDDVARGRVMQIRRVARDSNGELRLSLNSSAFGVGDYDLKLEGYTWRGETVPVGWVRLGMK